MERNNLFLDTGDAENWNSVCMYYGIPYCFFLLEFPPQDNKKYIIVSIQLISFVISELNKASGKSQAPAVFRRGKSLR